MNNQITKPKMKKEKLFSTTEIARELEAEHNNKPQKAFNSERNLYKAELMELITPAYRECIGLASIFKSPEHEAVQMLCELLKSGHANEVVEALSPIARLTSKLTERNELIDEVSEIVQSNFTVSILEDGTQEPMSICDSAIMQVELIGNLLIDFEDEE